MSLKQLSSFCSAEEIARNRRDEDSICPLLEMRELERDKGRWRLVGEELRHD